MIASVPAVDIDRLLSTASAVEKISLLAGSDFWHTAALPAYGVPRIRCTDGPNGVRGTKFFSPTPSVCIPCGTALGATWNTKLIEQAGELLAKECSAKGAQVWLGPTVNICRSPLNGRGFECFSEDPYLTGMLAAAIIRGVQSRGTMAAIKHFVANDQETEKTTIDVQMCERTLREIYLRPFQIALRDSQPGVLMASYNKVNGTHTSESKLLLGQILRQEWGFRGLIISDWFGTYSGAASLEAGLDLEMPGPPRYRLPSLANDISLKTLNARTRKVLQFVNEAALAPKDSSENIRNTPHDRKLNRRLAHESVVLLKNDEQLLPIDREHCSYIAVIGPNAKLAAACGGGSANLEAYYTTSVYDGIAASVSPTTSVRHEAGIYTYDMLPLLTKDVISSPIEVQFFHERHSTADRSPFDQATIRHTNYQLMDYTHPLMSPEFYICMSLTFTPPESGTYEFGLSSYGISDLYVDGARIIDNSTEQSFGGMFFGKGSVEKRGVVVGMEGGRTYLLRVEAGSASTSKSEDKQKPTMPIPGGACRLGGVMKIAPEEGLRRAVNLASQCKHTFVVVGLHSDLEKEGKDRQSMSLPPHSDDLVNAVLAANPSAVIITQSGQPVSMPWRNTAKTLLHTWYGGNEGGNAVADVIFGRINPSGRLPVTFPARLEDGPSYLSFGSDNGSVHYSEGVFVGYRWWEARKKESEVAFAFGHGLSYTTFGVSDLRVNNNSTVHIEVKNTGPRAGAEVVRFYVAFATDSTTETKSRFLRPIRCLVGFCKLELEPGESQTAELLLDKYSTAVWDDKAQAWCCEAGEYDVSVVVGSEEVKGRFEIDEETFWTGL